MTTINIKATLIAICAILSGATSMRAQEENRLYIIGDAVGGWDLSLHLKEMNRTGDKYSWEGELKAGELKFLKKNDWLPSFGPVTAGTEIANGTTTSDLCERTDYESGDNKFKVLTSGTYRILVNMENEGKATFTTYPVKVYPSGTGITDNNIVMSESSFGSGIYRAENISLKYQGKLVFLKQPDGDGGYYGPATDGANISSAAINTDIREYNYKKIRQIVMAPTQLALYTDKACYNPNATVSITSSPVLPAGAKVRYRHNGKIVGDETLSSTSWTWTAPADDYKGYMAEIYTEDGDKDIIHGTIGIDVSSDWKKFPRYGFIATFTPTDHTGGKTHDKVQEEMAWLNRCHINGVQFQDWHWKHHRPCHPDNADGTLWDCYEDLSGRWISSTVICDYINEQHSYGMKSIFYNLAFGVLGDWLDNGDKSLADWSDQWYLYEDNSRTKINKHPLKGIGWKSDIYLTNPANADWLKYLAARNTETYAKFNFDGYQIDQLGGRGDVYDYNGNAVSLWETYTPFINAMKAAHPEKRLIMNAVSEYGTWGIARTGNVDMFYNEVWSNSTGEDHFDNLFRIIKDNEKMDANIKTVFAAYMNYGAHGRNPSNIHEYFNTPGILLTDATIFALGGAHLELGDHMLCDEYFPNSDMKMSDELKTAMEHYYDFHTAYENLLRGAGTELTTGPTSSTVNIKPWYSTNTDGNISVTNMEIGKVMSYSRQVGGQQVINLINYRDADSTSWRDYEATMPEPTALSDISVSVTTNDAISRVWVASPDYNAGAVQDLNFTKSGDTVSFTVPNLKYWTMIVME